MASLAFPSLTKSVTLKDGTKYGYIRVAAKPGKATLLFLHGYPSAAYEWRHQIAQVSDAGYGMIAPDLLGYGDTDKPEDLESYELSRMGGHITEILDHEGLDKVVGIAHDWGCGLLSALAQRHENRFHVFVFMTVGYIAHGAAFADIDGVNAAAVEALGRPIFGYWKFHIDPNAGRIMDNANKRSIDSLVYPADPEIWKTHICVEGGLRNWIEKGETAPRPSWLTKEEEEMHDKTIAIGGYGPPLNWYKQAVAGVSAKKEADLSEEDRKIKIPTLYIGGEKDFICVPAMNEAGMKPFVSNLTVQNMDTTHWVMLEKPDEMWGIITGFLQKNNL